MYPNWEHWRDLKGTCPVCGKPSHVGVSMRTGRYYWLHDDYDIREYYREHGKHSSLASMELISSSQAMGTRGGGTSGSWFPGKPETPQKRHGKGCGGTPFSMPFLLSH